MKLMPRVEVSIISGAGKVRWFWQQREPHWRSCKPKRSVASMRSPSLIHKYIHTNVHIYLASLTNSTLIQRDFLEHAN